MKRLVFISVLVVMLGCSSTRYPLTQSIGGYPNYIFWQIVHTSEDEYGMDHFTVVERGIVSEKAALQRLKAYDEAHHFIQSYFEPINQ